MRTLSELEGAVLGLVWVHAPCTTYRVRQFFLRSPSPHWSGSAGAVYPLLERLTRRRLLVFETRFTGRRSGREYRLSRRGLEELRRWTAGGISERTAGVPVDPLRVRIRFLGSLSPKQRNTFLSEARRKVRAHVRMVERDCRARRADGDTFSYLTARGALLALRARMTWLREVQQLASSEGLVPRRQRHARSAN
jgi:DNA-binding PadR family transcriptional regulator